MLPVASIPAKIEMGTVGDCLPDWILTCSGAAVADDPLNQ
jgi:hypothetical protein